MCIRFSPDMPVREQLVAMHSEAARYSAQWANRQGAGSVKGRYYWHGRAEVIREILAMVDSGTLTLSVLVPETPTLI